MAEQAPRGLRAGGKRFWQKVSGSFELSADEHELLIEACRCIDELDAINKAITASEPLIDGPRGTQIANPLFAEARSHRGVLNRLLKSLGLPDEDAAPESWTTIRAREAAQARWRSEREAARLHRHA